jgi:putative ABC transport system ATP-binding protein
VAAAGGLLIADEPSSRLDETGARIVAALLGTVAAEGHTVICASHDPILIDAADEILELGPARRSEVAELGVSTRS